MTYKTQEPPIEASALPNYLSQELRRVENHLAYWDLEENHRYESVSIPATALKASASGAPDFGSLTGLIQTYLFDNSAVESLYFSAQVPRSYREGQPITPYVNWCATTTTASAAIVWEIIYAWANEGSALSAVTLTAATSCTSSLIVTSTTLSAISGNDKEIGSILIGRLSRLSSDVRDTYSYDVGVLSLEFRYPKDAHGSRRETIK